MKIQKSIWLESSKNTKNKHWVQLFEDLGIPDNHITLEGVDKALMFHEIVNADQICFMSSFVGNSLELIDIMVEALAAAKITNKIFISGGYLLESLNSGYKLTRATKDLEFFEHNYVFEIHEGEIRWIGYDYLKKKFIYTDTPIDYKKFVSSNN